MTSHKNSNSALFKILEKTKVDDETRFIESLNEYIDNLETDYQQFEIKKNIKFDKKWFQINSEINLQKDLNELLKLEIQRTLNFKDRFEIEFNQTIDKSKLKYSDAGITPKSSQLETINADFLNTFFAKNAKSNEFELQKKNKDLMESNQLLEKNLEGLEAEKKLLQRGLNEYNEWRKNLIVRDEEKNSALEQIESIQDCFSELDDLGYLFNIGEYSHDLIQNINAELECSAKSRIGVSNEDVVENLNGTKEVDMLNKISTFLEERQDECSKLRQELMLLKTEEEDIQELNTVIASLSLNYKIQ